MPTTKLRPVTPAAVKAMLGDGKELALIDVREELTFSQNHLLWARNVPLSRLELRFAPLVPRKSTRIVLSTTMTAWSQRAAAILARAGYSDIANLDGGMAGWEKAGFVTFSGVHVPSKAFGEFVEHDSGTPSVCANELDALMHDGTKLVVLDSRPFDEYTRVSIPTGINVPGAELVLRVRDIAPSPDTTIVVNCAGRTRSIIGAQSLINAGIAQQGDGAAQRHHGLASCRLDLRQRQDRPRAAAFAAKASPGRRQAAEGGRDRNSASRAPTAPRSRQWRKDATRTTYVFDVRDPAEYLAGHFPARSPRPAGNWCRRPTSMPARSARASWSATTRKCAR